jgi:DNA-binding transcriptional ArsR family regulator
MRREADVFRALSDATRRRLFEQVCRREASVKALTARLSVSQPAVSQHLATLRDARLVSERRDGRHVYYRARPEGLAPLVRWIDRYRVFWGDRLARLERLLDDMPDDAKENQR